MLRQERHECWTAGAVGLATASDDTLSVWASNHRAAVVTHDQEFSLRRMHNAIGHHVWLRCNAWDASDVLRAHLGEVVARLSARSDLTIRVSKDQAVLDSSEWS